MKLCELIRRIERAVPLEWALPDDPVGLQIGDPDQDVKRVAVSLEVTSKILQKAVRQKVDLLLVHHPLLFRPLKKIVETDAVQRLVRELIRRDIALYAAHTNIDLHPQGIAALWAKKLGCVNAHCVAAKPQAGRLKIVTFVPADYTDRVREALAQAGAGVIGEYDLCSFTLQGTGTFRGSGRANPFVGRAGQLEREEEDRLEMVLPIKRRQAVIHALYTVHPYEEPAYDLYPLQDARGLEQALWVVEFEKKLSWAQFETRVKKSLPIPVTLVVVRPDTRRKIQTIALSTGSGNSLISCAASMGVDAYLTGEVGYHLLWEAEELGLNVLTVGHGASESIFPEAIVPLVEKSVEGVTWVKM